MKDLKRYIKESILDDIDVQMDNMDMLLITKWLKENIRSIQENKLKFDFSTTPITVDYDGVIYFKDNITSLTNGTFQWGKVDGDFSCHWCDLLKSLEGGPKEVGGGFYCSKCKSLKSLEGGPKEVGDDFWCSECKSLMSLNGAPKKVGMNFKCCNCGKQFTENDVKKICKVKGKIYC